MSKTKLQGKGNIATGMKRLVRRIYFFICVFLFSSHPLFTHALEVNGYDPSLNDRFVSGTYGTGSPSLNPGFAGSSYDWSGVGWQSDLVSRSVAMVSPLHFVSSNHYRIPEGGSVAFYNRDGQLKSYTVQKYSTFTSTDGYGTHTADLAIGWLCEAIPASDKVSYYPVLNADDPGTPGFDHGWYSGRDSFLYGWDARAGITPIDALSLIATTPTYSDLTWCWKYIFHTGAGYEGEAGGQGGDSGSPSFLPWAGGLTILGSHFAISTPTGEGWSTLDSAVQLYINDINLAMAPSGYQLDVIYTIPEPMTVLLLGVGLAGLITAKRKKRT